MTSQLSVELSKSADRTESGDFDACCFKLPATAVREGKEDKDEDAPAPARGGAGGSLQISELFEKL